MAPPKVSVIMSTYNHAPYVAQTVLSVLGQTFADFEFLVADDGSNDGTSDIVRQFSDSRLQHFPNDQNRGACTVTNELIQRARGDYVAVINSDDYWAPEKLAVQVEVMEKELNYAAHFTGTVFVDKAGATIPVESVHFGDVFRQPNRSQGRWLRRLFDGGNCLCHPSILIRRSCYRELGSYDNRFRQLPDYDMWIRLLKKHPILVGEQRLVYFRLMPGENTSSHTTANVVRASNEHYLIACGYFDSMPMDVLIDGFADEMVLKTPPSEEHCDIEKALLYFKPNRWLGHIYNAVGVRRLFELLRSPRHREVLRQDYRIDDLDFQKLTATAQAFRQPLDPRTISRAELFGELKRRAHEHLNRRLRRFRFRDS